MQTVVSEHTQRIIDAAERRENTQFQIAAEYARAIIRGEIEEDEEIDWQAANRAILARYKPSGLARIKGIAWALCEPAKP